MYPKPQTIYEMLRKKFPNVNFERPIKEYRVITPIHLYDSAVIHIYLDFFMNETSDDVNTEVFRIEL